MKNTPTPYHYLRDSVTEEITIYNEAGRSIADIIGNMPIDEANAKHIVNCVNNHEILIEHIKDLIEQINQFPQISKAINVKYAQQALKQAESEV